MEGASWNKNKDLLAEPIAKLIHVSLPLLLINADIVEPPPVKNAPKKYFCPVYKTPFRTGLNYIFSIFLNTDKEPNEWILKGTALVC